jgi:peroxiredoxin
VFSIRASLIILTAYLALPSLAGEFNQKLNIGDAAPAFTKLPGVDGKEHSLVDFQAKPYLLVVFTCNSCPCAVDYEDRIIAFAQANAEKVGVVAINVNAVPADSLEKMKERQAERKFPYPYIQDASQKIAKDYGAEGTPEVFLLSPERKVIYMGAIDDSDDATQVKHKYLDDALTAALAGKSPEVKETFANGCRIRWERRRPK